MYGGDMTREELLKHHEVVCKQARDLMDKKNRDYAGNDGKGKSH